MIYRFTIFVASVAVEMASAVLWANGHTIVIVMDGNGKEMASVSHAIFTFRLILIFGQQS